MRRVKSVVQETGQVATTTTTVGDVGVWAGVFKPRAGDVAGIDHWNPLEL